MNTFKTFDYLNKDINAPKHVAIFVCGLEQSKSKLSLMFTAILKSVGVDTIYIDNYMFDGDADEQLMTTIKRATESKVSIIIGANSSDPKYLKDQIKLLKKMNYPYYIFSVADNDYIENLLTYEEYLLKRFQRLYQYDLVNSDNIVSFIDTFKKNQTYLTISEKIDEFYSDDISYADKKRYDL